jgi:primosomal protein N' (replication factor Y)
VGTQRVEATLNEQFPQARTLRMDVDTTRRKGAHDRILSAFRRGEADILLGTQMVAKGLDFPGVTLVGVISADTGIHLPDFRAGERTFQLLTQVSGRAGRGERPGEVVVQTYVPQHASVQAARTHDFASFAHAELEARRSAGYPPFGRMALLLLRGRSEADVSRTAGGIADRLRGAGIPGVDVMGPGPAPLLRLRGSYRWQIMLKSPSASALNRAARAALDAVRPGRGGSHGAVRLDVDIDPVSML